MVHILKDVSVNVISAEVDTVGMTADDTLLVSYHGEALNASMQQLVKNALQCHLYHLRHRFFSLKNSRQQYIAGHALHL
eukprot:scaffold122652_cov24-Prasinocladus_malaysianus.AAC.1